MVPTSVTNQIVDDVQGLFESYQFSMTDIVKHHLQGDYSPESLDYWFQDEDLFSVICQASKSEGALSRILYRDYPYTEPSEILLGESENKRHLMHVVPLHTVLRNLLYHEDIRTSIKTHLNNKRRSNNTNKLYDSVHRI